MYATPFCYLFSDTTELYYVFRACYASYCCRLHTVSSNPVLPPCTPFPPILYYTPCTPFPSVPLPCLPQYNTSTVLCITSPLHMALHPFYLPLFLSLFLPLPRLYFFRPPFFPLLLPPPFPLLFPHPPLGLTRTALSAAKSNAIIHSLRTTSTSNALSRI